jgi:hypothetical protein
MNLPNSMEMKELHSMKRHRGLFLGLALSALLGLSASQANAETIDITVQVGAGPVVDLAIFGGVGSANGYVMNDAAVFALNSFLTTSSSQYLFGTGATTLGGISNFPGSSSAGALELTGTILSVRSGTAALTLRETESGFTAPTGPSGTLFSSSTGDFANAAAGTGHTASSSFNGTSTPTYSVLSTTTNPNPAGGMANIPVSPVPTLYTLTNSITFNLKAGTTANPIVDGFAVVAVVTAIPEPASLVMMLTGIPLPIVVIGLLRRRRASA